MRVTPISRRIDQSCVYAPSRSYLPAAYERESQPIFDRRAGIPPISRSQPTAHLFIDNLKIMRYLPLRTRAFIFLAAPSLSILFSPPSPPSPPPCFSFVFSTFNLHFWIPLPRNCFGTGGVITVKLRTAINEWRANNCCCCVPFFILV